MKEAPKFEHAPGCFDIIRRGNLPGIHIGAAPPPAPAPARPPLPVPRLYANAPRPLAPFPVFQQPVPQGFIPVPPTGPTDFFGFVTNFTDVSRQVASFAIEPINGKTYVTIFPYYSQGGQLVITGWMSGTPIHTCKKERLRKVYSCKAKNIPPPAPNKVWSASPPEIAKFILGKGK